MYIIVKNFEKKFYISLQLHFPIYDFLSKYIFVPSNKYTYKHKSGVILVKFLLPNTGGK